MYAPLLQKGMETGMKKFRIWILAALAAALCLLCGCSAEDFALPHEVQLAVGQQCALAGELRFTGSLSDITPQDRAEFAQAVTDAVVHIASTDPSVAAVDQDGNVTAVTPGTATVLVSCVDLDFYAEVNINVVEAATPETAGSLTPLMPMFDTADTGIAEYSGDIVQEDAATYDASYNTNEDVAANERDVYNYLTGTMGMNSAAASGVMASMYRESRFYVDITNDYGTAYGLCQWYGDRWTNLQNYCNNNGLDWHTLYGQMRFLEYELSSLSSLRSYMYGISNDADGAYHAGYEWCRVYELGGNTSDTTRCDSRGTLARDTFWPKYQNGSTGGYTGWRSENGRDYWYENGVKQGTTGRGKEIYDASSDAWYWLDAVDGGAKAVNKDVYQESDGGKWVRYDENGHMIKGENCQNGNWYYFEPVTGAMIHGPWTLPDGRKVYYDLTTGIMQYGNVSINGSLYYFDPVYGTMKSGALTNFWVTDGNGKSFWYESWVRQGWQPGSSNYRGKEIYDPASGAWYWLDNVQQGAKATSKEVYQDSNGGKWVRYDTNGHMIKGWYTQDGKTWYYDLTTGAMYKGWHTIEGSTYHFDETTGVKG